MTKWAVLALLVGMAAGVGLWIVLDPQARVAAAVVWNRGMALFAGVQAGTAGTSLWDPIARAFKEFADSVAGLWSPETIHIEMPSIQLPH